MEDEINQQLAFGHKYFLSKLVNIGSCLEENLGSIFKLMFEVYSLHSSGEEELQKAKYRKWFDKWGPFIESYLMLNKSGYYDGINRGYMNNYRVYETFYRTMQDGTGHIIQPKKETSIYLKTGSNPDVGLSYNELVNILPEMLGSFSNTFIHNVVSIKDSKGKERKITIVNKKLSSNKKIKELIRVVEDNNLFSRLYKFVYGFEKKYQIKTDLQMSVIGFIKGKSYVDHAKRHVGSECIITCDLNKFYNSINLTNIIETGWFNRWLIEYYNQLTRIELKLDFNKPSDVYLKLVMEDLGKLFFSLMSYYTCNGMLPTGTSYSPIATNFLMFPVDKQIKKLTRKYRVENKEGWPIDFCNFSLLKEPCDIRYTRYVDDLAFSISKAKKDDGSYVLGMDFLKQVEGVLNQYNLHLNYTKTKIMGPKDSKIICGLNVDRSVSIGSKKKLELKKYFEGKNINELNASDRGLLSWIKSVNQKQYSFIISGIVDSKKLIKQSAKKSPKTSIIDEFSTSLRSIDVSRFVPETEIVFNEPNRLGTSVNQSFEIGVGSNATRDHWQQIRHPYGINFNHIRAGTPRIEETLRTSFFEQREDYITATTTWQMPDREVEAVTYHPVHIDEEELEELVSERDTSSIVMNSLMNEMTLNNNRIDRRVNDCIDELVNLGRNIERTQGRIRGFSNLGILDNT